MKAEFLAVAAKSAGATADARQRVKIHEWKFHFVIIARNQLLQTALFCRLGASDCVRVIGIGPLRTSQRGTYFRGDRSRRAAAQVHAEDLLGDCPIDAATMRTGPAEPPEAPS